MNDKQIIQKLFKIAKNQQKIIEKMAQNQGGTEQRLRAAAQQIIQYTRQWLKDKVDLGIVEIVPRVTEEDMVEISLKAKTMEAYEKINSQSGAYKAYITPIVNKLLPNYQVFTYIYAPEGQSPGTKPYDPSNPPKLAQSLPYKPNLMIELKGSMETKIQEALFSDTIPVIQFNYDEQTASIPKVDITAAPVASETNCQAVKRAIMTVAASYKVKIGRIVYNGKNC